MENTTPSQDQANDLTLPLDQVAKSATSDPVNPALTIKHWPSEEEEAARRRERRIYRDQTDAEARFVRWRDLVRRFGARYEGCSFDTFLCSHQGQVAALNAIRHYVDLIEANINQGRNIVLFGPSGTGKDHLLVASARVAVARDFSLEWINGLDLYGRFRATMDGSGADSEADVISAMVRPDILYLSDPLPPTPNAKLTDYQAGQLYRLCDRRYRDLRPIWISLNVADAAEAEERLGVPVVDRLRHGALAVHCQWPSCRKAKP